MDDHEYVFWMGDSNSHLLANTGPETQRVQQALVNNEWSFLINNHDELTRARSNMTGEKKQVSAKRNLFISKYTQTYTWTYNIFM